MIILRDICKSYDGAVILNHISMIFPENRMTCLMGESGCGKTTLLHILAGLIQPDNGTISGITGKKLSMVFQENRLMKNLTPVRNIELVCRKDPDIRSEIISALSVVGLRDEDMQKKVSEMSGGMQRRTAIVRAMVAPSDLIIMDEPYKGLDEDTLFKVKTFVRERSQGKAVLMVTHDILDAEESGVNLIRMPNRGEKQQLNLQKN